jgi:hypothetical protein
VRCGRKRVAKQNNCSPKIESGKRFENSRAEVKFNGQWVFIDKKGKVVK